MNGVQVSVEVPIENSVYEITYDGQELLQTPLTMSENLSRLSQKIDFSGTNIKEEIAENCGDHSNKNGTAKEEEEAGTVEGTTFKTTPLWPWDSVRNKLRTALTELSVLGDILKIAQEKKYLVLDPVQAEPSESKVASLLIYKKKALHAASLVLTSGCEKLRASLNDAKTKSTLSSLPDFHIELLKLRQNWRLRKVGNSILGDLSYRTAGSRFHQAGLFEVTKAEDDPENAESGEESSSLSNIPSMAASGSHISSASLSSSSTGKPPLSSLRVTVPKDLQGITYIQVLIQKDQDILSLANIGLLGNTPTPTDAHWQQRLEAAQNVLFCKELFSVLAREAVTLNSLPIPPLVAGNQITASLFPGILLIIGLCYGGSPSTSKDGHGTAQKSNPNPKLDHNHVLEHSLHQLLRELHKQNSCVALPHPATAPLGVPKKRRLAGPLAFNRNTLLSMTKKETILEEMIRQAQHVVLRLRTMYVLDALSREIKDPVIVAHWASLSAVTHSCVKITLLSSGYDMIARTPLMIHVKEKSLKCILKDGRAIHLSYEPQELRDIILSQIAIHQVLSLQTLSKCLGWTVLGSTSHIGVGPCENLGNAAGCLLSSPHGKRVIAVRSSPHNPQGLQVYIGNPDEQKEGVEPIQNPDWTIWDYIVNSKTSDSSHLKQIRMDKMEGKNFLNKMEMLMASVADFELTNLL